MLLKHCIFKKRIVKKNVNANNKYLLKDRNRFNKEQKENVKHIYCTRIILYVNMECSRKSYGKVIKIGKIQGLNRILVSDKLLEVSKDFLIQPLTDVWSFDEIRTKHPE